MQRQPTTLPFVPFVPLFETRPTLAAWKLGLVLAMLKVLLALLLLGLLTFVPEEYRGKSAAAFLVGAHPAYLLFIAVVFAPLWETIPGQVVPIELLRRLRAHWSYCVLASGAVFGAGHFLAGGLAHGVVTFLTGLVLGYGYMAARPYGFGTAFITAATAHACHNALLLFVIDPLWTSLEKLA
ncbi:CPBP family glutamic-type intramembrane protease [Massilia oculi]|uniref:CPBP family glutamic-type intramembrane protease n=1 Tax=Massilia oculi TaxID=945844 RepID=UPI0028A8BAF4|nr:CPBP family glutamic-type intramembrane protease [Massilia oculi]